MGGYNRNIYGPTPPKQFHADLLRLCEHISEGMDVIFIQCGLDLISHVIVRICKDSRRQSERDFPDTVSFHNCFIYVKSLKVKERFAHVYCIFLYISNSHLIEKMCAKKRKGTGEVNTPTNLTTGF